MKPLVIFHANCADGFGAAFAAWLKLGDEAEYLPMQYGEILAEDNYRMMFRGIEVYILDFSFPKQVMGWLFEVAKRVVWLDHHKTAFEMWCPEERSLCEESFGERAQHTVILNNNKSGAMLAWEYFHPGTEVPMLIRHIDDYDRWQFKLEGTKEFNKVLWSCAPWSFAVWKAVLDSMLLGGYEELLAQGAAILRAHDQNVQSVVKGAKRECVIEHQKQSPAGIWIGNPMTWGGLAANCPPHLTSDVGHQLANESGTFGLCWYINHEGKCLCSLRSNGDYDVSAIAKAFGGGGHRNAAGFEVAVQTLLGWLK